MASIRLPRPRRLYAAIALLLAAGAASATAAPMIVFYATPATNRKIIKPGAANALPIDGRIFVQEPNVGHLFVGDGDRPYRLSSVSEAQLITAATASGLASLPSSTNR